MEVEIADLRADLKAEQEACLATEAALAEREKALQTTKNDLERAEQASETLANTLEADHEMHRIASRTTAPGNSPFVQPLC